MLIFILQLHNGVIENQATSWQAFYINYQNWICKKNKH